MSANTNPESEWERSAFAMTSDELDVHEALNALTRLLHASHLSPEALQAVRRAFEQLSGDGVPRA